MELLAAADGCDSSVSDENCVSHRSRGGSDRIGGEEQIHNLCRGPPMLDQLWVVAIMAISIVALRGRLTTPMVVRAGYGSENCFA